MFDVRTSKDGRGVESAKENESGTLKLTWLSMSFWFESSSVSDGSCDAERI